MNTEQSILNYPTSRSIQYTYLVKLSTIQYGLGLGKPAKADVLRNLMKMTWQTAEIGGWFSDKDTIAVC